MNYTPDSRPVAWPTEPADPLDVFKRLHPWAKPIEMPRPGQDQQPFKDLH